MLSENEKQLFTGLFNRMFEKDMVTEKRPLQDAAIAADIFFQNANGVLDSYKMAGEVKLVVDVFQFKEVLTIHIPIPPKQ